MDTFPNDTHDVDTCECVHCECDNLYQEVFTLQDQNQHLRELVNLLLSMQYGR